MADSGLIHYQPLTGPVWREPVASRLAWLPKDQPAVQRERRVPSELVWSPFYSLYNPATLQWIPSGRDAKPLERRILGDFAFLPFGALYNPATLQWIPSGRWPLPPETRKLGDFQQPAFDALYKPEQLGWNSPAYYVGRAAQRGSPDATVFPIQFTAPAFNPQNLEWIPKGTPPQTFLELRKSSEFAQPAFDALYKPEGLQWLFEGQLWARSVPYAIQSGWTVDPTSLIPPAVPFDPQFFPFETVGAPLPQQLLQALQSTFDGPPLPPGPDVIVVDTGLGGSNAVHPRRRVVYEKPDRPKPRDFIDKLGEPVDLLAEALAPETVQEIVRAEMDATAVQSALKARVPEPREVELLKISPAPDDDDEDDLLLLS